MLFWHSTMEMGAVECTTLTLPVQQPHLWSGASKIEVGCFQLKKWSGEEWSPGRRVQLRDARQS